jgi:hypothetical protein
VKPSIQFVRNATGTFGKGLVAGVDMGGKIGIESGLFYEQLKYREAPTASLALGEAHLRSNGDFRGLSIPLKVNYRFNTGRIVQPTVQAGVTAFVPLREEYVFEYAYPANYTHTGSQQMQADLSGSVRADTLTIRNNAESFNLDSKSTSAVSSNGSLYNSASEQASSLYMMASAGGGVRVFASPRLSFHLSANYVHPLSDIGIEERSLKQVDVGLGMQYYLN